MAHQRCHIWLRVDYHAPRLRLQFFKRIIYAPSYHASNWLKDAQGDTVARFFSGFGATWGAGSSDMGGTNPKGSRLPKTIHLSYYDYQEDRFYRLEAELPLHRIYELFFNEPKFV